MSERIDLERGVVPISKAASSLAELLKRAKADHVDIVVTQKGYPAGVLLDIERYNALRDLELAALQSYEEGESNGS